MHARVPRLTVQSIVSSSLDGYVIPPLSSSLAQVLSIVSNNAQTSALQPLTRAVESDPALATYVLRRVNSPFYGVSRHVESVGKAVRLLGGKTVCEITLEAGLRQAFPYLESASTQNIYQLLMQTSIMTAQAAQRLSDTLRVPHHQQAFLAGLLHQVGRLVALNQHKQAYASVWYDLTDGGQTNDAPALRRPSRADELKAVGTDYLTLGRKVASHWHLPEVTQVCLRWQESPEDVSHVPFVPIVFAVRVASLYAYYLVLSTPPDDGVPTLDELPDDLQASLMSLSSLRKKAPDDLLELLWVHRDEVEDAARARTD